jgi:oxygen-dependent protoporphyrinogen oxidase
VVVVGGGITGLAACYFLERHTSHNVTLIEASQRLGGKIETLQSGGLTIEQGPDCFFSRKPAAVALISELGIERDIIEPARNEFLMLVEGQLQRVPRGLLNFTNLTKEALDDAGFLSQEGRKRALKERHQPKGEGGDESLASFFRRRFGPEFSKKVAEPLLAGTHSGSAERLSMKALYAGYLDIERRSGQLSACHFPVSQGPAFLSLRKGMEELTKRLRNALTRTLVRTSMPITCLETDKLFAGDEAIAFDEVILTVDARAAAHMVRSSLPHLAEMLQKIEFSSSLIVTLAYDRNQIGRTLDATGFLVATDEESVLAGSTWSSEKWRQRSPGERVLIRAFLKPYAETDDELSSSAHAAIAELLGITGAPIAASVKRWDNAMPQYNLGHSELVTNIERETQNLQWLHLAGSSYRGVGIPDCIDQARIAVEAVS